MGNTWVICDAGKITCPHGGVVELKSNETMYRIAEKKPLLHKDIVGAKISGCKLPKVAGGPCKSVVCVGGADTEHNVMGVDGTFLLRVDGCKTDKGYPLILENPGQTKWKISVQRTLIAGKIEATEAMTPEGMYFIMPMRKSYDQETIKPLRPSRDFRKLPEYYAFKDIACDGLLNVKISTYVNARLYVCETSSNNVTEYMVINDSQDVSRPLFNPSFGQINFIDLSAVKNRDKTQNNQNCVKSLNAIPCEFDKTYELFYSDIPIPIINEDGTLNEKIASQFRPQGEAPTSANYLKMTINDKATCVDYFFKESEEASKAEKLSDAADAALNIMTYVPSKTTNLFAQMAKMAKRRVEGDKPAKHGVFYLAAIMDDPIGEIEDLYNDYEFSFKYRYAHNKPAFDDLRNKNAYAYEIAKAMDFFYVNKDEQDKHDKVVDKLDDIYDDLVEYVTDDLETPLLEMMTPDLDLSAMIDKNVAETYIAKTLLLKSDFFDDYDEFSMYVFKCNKHYFYVPENSDEKPLYGYLRRLKFKSGEFDPNMDVWRALALFTFSIAFSDRYADLRSRYPKFIKLCDEFYATLIVAPVPPQLGEKAIEKIRNKLMGKRFYQDLFRGGDPLIKEFEDIDRVHKLVSFNLDTSLLKFKSLQQGSRQIKDEISTDKDVKSAKEIAPLIRAKFKDKRFIKALDIYKSAFEWIKSDNAQDGVEARMFNYSRYMLGLLYNIIAPRAKIEEEIDALSPFTDDAKAIADTILFVCKELYGYLTENSPDVMDALIKGSEQEDAKGSEQEGAKTNVAHQWFLRVTQDDAIDFIRDNKDDDSYILFHKALSVAVIHAKNQDKRSEYGKNVDTLLGAFYDNDNVSPAKPLYTALFGNDKDAIEEINRVKNAMENLSGAMTIAKAIKKWNSANNNLDGADSVGSGSTKSIGTQDTKADERIKTLQKTVNRGAYKWVVKVSEFVAFAGTGANIYAKLTNEEPLSARDMVELANEIISFGNAAIGSKYASDLSKLAGDPSAAKFARFSSSFAKFAGKAAPVLAITLYCFDFYEAATKDKRDSDDGRKLIFISLHIVIATFEIAAVFSQCWVVLLVTIPLHILLGIAEAITTPNFDLYVTVCDIADSIGKMLRDLPIENYIERSLYYQETPLIDFCSIKPVILCEVTNNKREFETPNDLRQYLAVIHDSNKSLYREAMEAETTELLAAVKDYMVEAKPYDDDSPKYVIPLAIERRRGDGTRYKDDKTRINVYNRRYLTLSDSLINDAKYIAIAHRCKGEYYRQTEGEPIKTTYDEYMHDDNQSKYVSRIDSDAHGKQIVVVDIVARLIELGFDSYEQEARKVLKTDAALSVAYTFNSSKRIEIIKDILDSSALIVVTKEDAKLKFSIEYDVDSKGGNGVEVDIDDIVPTRLNDYDRAILKEKLREIDDNANKTATTATPNLKNDKTKEIKQ